MSRERSNSIERNAHDEEDHSKTYKPSWATDSELGNKQASPGITNQERGQPTFYDPSSFPSSTKEEVKNDGSFHYQNLDESLHGTEEEFSVKQMLDSIDLQGLNEDEEQSAVVQDIEEKNRGNGPGVAELVEFHSQNEGSSNKEVPAEPRPVSRRVTRSMSEAAGLLLSKARMQRKSSIDSNDYVAFKASDSTRQEQEGCAKGLYSIGRTLRFLFPHMQYRINIYLVVLFILIVQYTAQGFTDTTPDIFQLFFATAGLELVCSVLDRCLYKAIDIVFASRFDVAYQLHCINGPIGQIATIIIIRNFWHIFRARSLIPGWRTYVTVAAVFVLVLFVKNWLSRKQYINLLESRFTSKVENLNTMMIILSELASTRPPRTALLKPSTSNTSIGTNPPNNIHRSALVNNPAVQGAVKGGQLAVKGGQAAFKGGKRVAGKVGPNVILGVLNHADVFRGAVVQVVDVFKDVVSPDDDEADPVTKMELYQRRRSFWQSAARLAKSSGTIKVITYNGLVTIRSQDQARQFGRKLYQHLSKGGKQEVTPDLIRRLFEERREAARQDQFDRLQREADLAHVTAADISRIYDAPEDERKELWSVAVGLFDPFGLGRVTEEFCVEAVVNIYKEQRFTAASINDFGELHKSLKYVIELAYWIVIAFIMQFFLDIDITSYILPFVTLLLAVSFAISTLVGNIMLSFAFVFFMQPFDVGDSVQLGINSHWSPPMSGTVKNITFSYTILTTGKNETAKCPNHVLFFERIYNFTEGAGGAVSDFTISFNMFGMDNTKMETINTFFQKLKQYCLRESHQWKSFSVSVGDWSAVDNVVNFKVLLVHRETSGSKAVNAAKIDFYATVKRLKEELGLTFARPSQLVSVLQLNPDKRCRSHDDLHTSTSTDGTDDGQRSRFVAQEDEREEEEATQPPLQASPMEWRLLRGLRRGAGPPRNPHMNPHPQTHAQTHVTM